MQPKKVRRDEKIPYSNADMHPDLMEFISTRVSNALARLNNKAVTIKSKKLQSIENLEFIYSKVVQVTGDMIVAGISKCKELHSKVIYSDVINTNNISSFRTESINAQLVDAKNIFSEEVSSKVVRADSLHTTEMTSKSSTILRLASNVAVIAGITFKNGSIEIFKSIKIATKFIQAEHADIRQMFKTKFDILYSRVGYVKRFKSHFITVGRIRSRTLSARLALLEKVQTFNIDSKDASIGDLKVRHISADYIGDLKVSELIRLLNVYKSSGLEKLTLMAYAEMTGDVYQKLSDINSNHKRLHEQVSSISDILDNHIKSNKVILPVFKDNLDMLKNTTKLCVGTIGESLSINTGRGIEKIGANGSTGMKPISIELYMEADKEYKLSIHLTKPHEAMVIVKDKLLGYTVCNDVTIRCKDGIFLKPNRSSAYVITFIGE